MKLSPPPAVKIRPTSVAIEVRLTTEETDALTLNLPMLALMLRRRVLFVRGGKSLEEPLVSALEKLLHDVELRRKPFDS